MIGKRDGIFSVQSSAGTVHYISSHYTGLTRVRDVCRRIVAVQGCRLVAKHVSVGLKTRVDLECFLADIRVERGGSIGYGSRKLKINKNIPFNDPFPP